MKFFKKFAAIFAAVLATACFGILATACNKEDEPKYATDTFTVIVKDENGNAIDGTTFGENDIIPGEPGVVKIQFCVVDPATGKAGACATPVETDNTGKATLSVETLVAAASANNSTKIELHIINVTNKGYVKGDDGEYGQFEVDKIPTTITVTLVKAA